MPGLIQSALLWAGILLATALLLIGCWLIWVLRHLPETQALTNYRPEMAAEVVDHKGLPIAQISDQRFRLWRSLAQISMNLQNAVLAAEDDRFFRHSGVNFQALWDAFRVNLRRRRYVLGGSTITQQLVKNIFLTPEKTISRKMKEIVLAQRIESVLPKERILELYLNQVEWAPRVFGAEAAARYYFGLSADQLSIPQAALLAGMLVNPNRMNPFRDPVAAHQRKDRILQLMKIDRFITKEEFDSAIEEDVGLIGQPQDRVPAERSLPCGRRSLTTEIRRRYDPSHLFHSGMTVATTLDVETQSRMEALIEAALPGSDRVERGSGEEVYLLTVEAGEIRSLICLPGGSAAESGTGAPIPPSVDPNLNYREVASREFDWEEVLKSEANAEATR